MAANPGAGSDNLQVTKYGAFTEHTELSFRGLYLHHIPLGPDRTQSTVLGDDAATGLGETAVNNWPIYDGAGAGAGAAKAVVVARAQGLHVHAGGWHNSFTIVFQDPRFGGSTLQVMGLSVEDGEWSIVGGTGQFAMATGIITKRLHHQGDNGNIIELTVHGFCPVINIQPIKNGPWGGSGGSPRDITETPRRLESVTIHSGWAIDSLAFSYIDQAGQKQTAGPWGGSGGDKNTINLGPGEVITEVSGTIGTYEGHLVVRSLKIVTNMKTYGPFGREQSTAFSSGGTVVGFFGRSGDRLDSIGTYTV